MGPFDQFPLTDEARRRLVAFKPTEFGQSDFVQSEKDTRPYSETAALSDLPTHHYSGYNNSIQHNTPDNRASDRGSFASRVGSWISERLPVGPNGPVDRTMDDVRNRTIAQNNHAFGRQNAPEVQAYVDRTDPIRAKNQQPWATTRDNFLHSVESAVTAPARAATGELQPYAFDPATGDVRNDAMIGEAFNLAGVAAMGGGMAVKPQSATRAFSNSDSKPGAVGVVASKKEPYAKARQAADDAFSKRINEDGHKYFHDWEYDPVTGQTIGSEALDDALRRGLDKGHHEFGQATADALEAAAMATGRELYMSPGGYGGSFYGDLKTPAGNSYKVRSSNHARTSGHHDAPDFNIAPGEMTPDEFIRKLPTIFSNADSKSGVAGIALANENKGIRAYHGSPHSFDKFDASKIGTGEGAQAFGYGHYFSENEAVAESYKKNLGDVQKILTASPQTDAETFVQKTIQRGSDDIGAIPDHTTAYDWISGRRQGGFDINELQDAYYALQDRGKAGHMYEVNINADPSHFLDWDKPISGQSDGIKNLLGKHFVDTRVDLKTGESIGLGNNVSSAINQWSHKDASKIMAEDLQKAGIPGIRYLDQGSRGAGEGSRNMVIFPGNEHLINITRKYANGHPLPGVAGINSSPQQELTDEEAANFLKRFGRK